MVVSLCWPSDKLVTCSPGSNTPGNPERRISGDRSWTDKPTVYQAVRRCHTHAKTTGGAITLCVWNTLASQKPESENVAQGEVMCPQCSWFFRKGHNKKPAHKR